MPYFGIKLHYWRTKRILSGYPDIDSICPPFVRCSWRAFERAFEMCQVLSIPQWTSRYVQQCIIMGICNFFRDATGSVGCHDEWRLAGTLRMRWKSYLQGPNWWLMVGQLMLQLRIAVECWITWIGSNKFSCSRLEKATGFRSWKPGSGTVNVDLDLSYRYSKE